MDHNHYSSFSAIQNAPSFGYARKWAVISNLDRKLPLNSHVDRGTLRTWKYYRVTAEKIGFFYDREYFLHNYFKFRQNWRVHFRSVTFIIYMVWLVHSSGWSILRVSLCVQDISCINSYVNFPKWKYCNFRKACSQYLTPTQEKWPWLPLTTAIINLLGLTYWCSYFI